MGRQDLRVGFRPVQEQCDTPGIGATPEKTRPALSVVIAARNEAAWLPRCLAALLAQDTAQPVEVIVAANGCTDDTAALAHRQKPAFAARGWTLVVLDLGDVGKLGALNAADAAARVGARAYLDADVLCDPGLLEQVIAALQGPQPRYVTGTLVVARGQTAITRAYARIWSRLPFVTGGAVGAGFFALNAAGRARWRDWPDIISDDTFARLHFTPAERHEVPACYHWPMVEGFANLVRVRRRQDAGVAEIARLYPDLPANEAKAPLTAGRLGTLAIRDPAGFAVYIAVHLAVRLRRSGGGWTRGR